MDDNSLIKDIGRSYIVSSFMPAALFVSVGVLIFKEYLSLFADLQFLQIVNFDGTKWFLFAAFTAWIAFCLYSISDWTIRLYEGYLFPKPIRQILTSIIREKWHKKNTTNIQALNAIPREKEFIFQRAEYIDSALIEYANFGNLAPIEEKMLLPTKFGNIMRACEIYPNERYEIRGIVVWSRILQVFPKHFKDQLEEKNNQMIFLLNSSLLSYIIGFSALVIGSIKMLVTIGNGYLDQTSILKLFMNSDFSSSRETAANGCLMILVGLILYKIALPVAEGFGALIRTGYDLYRFDLLRQLNQPIPTNDEDECDIWRKVSELFIAGKNLGIEALSFSYYARKDLLDYIDMEEYKKRPAKKCWFKSSNKKL